MSLPSQLLGMGFALALVTGVRAAPVSVEVQPDRIFNRPSGIGETQSEKARVTLMVAACFLWTRPWDYHGPDRDFRTFAR